MKFYKMHSSVVAQREGISLRCPADLKRVLTAFVGQRDSIVAAMSHLPDEVADAMFRGTVGLLAVEQYHLRNGGVIVVDEAMAEAFARTDLKGMSVSDIHLPFPSVELAIPDAICERFGVSPMIFTNFNPVMDIFRPELAETGYNLIATGAESDYFVSASAPVVPGKGECMPMLNMHCKNDILRNGADDPELKSCYGSNRIAMDIVEPATYEAKQACCSRSMQFLAVVLLYLQSTERQKALQPVTIKRLNHCREGNDIKRLRNRLPARQIVNICEKSRVRYEGGTGTHASPEAHWVRGHIRCYRHERFYRNPDGSMRTEWIMPFYVGDKQQTDARAVRVLNVQSAA